MKLQPLFESQLAKPSISLQSGDRIVLKFDTPLMYNHHYAKNTGMQTGVLSGYRIEPGDKIEIVFRKNRDDNFEFEFYLWGDKRRAIEGWEAGTVDIEWVQFALKTVLSSLQRIIQGPEVEKVKQFFQNQLSEYS